jgi:hypothetical protein
MSSWRDSHSEEVQADVDGLLNTALSSAQRMLGKHGEFPPYAFELSEDGETGMVATYPGQGGHSSLADILSLLYDGLGFHSMGLRAVAVISCVRIDLPSMPTDAIRVEIEHREGVAIAVLFPYKKRFGRGVTYGDLQAAAGERRIWSEQ